MSWKDIIKNKVPTLEETGAFDGEWEENKDLVASMNTLIKVLKEEIEELENIAIPHMSNSISLAYEEEIKKYIVFMMKNINGAVQKVEKDLE